MATMVNKGHAHAEAIRLANLYGLDAYYWQERGEWHASPWGQGFPGAITVRPVKYHSCR